MLAEQMLLSAQAALGKMAGLGKEHLFRADVIV